MFRSLFARLEKRPVVSFIVVLAVLFGVIALASTLRAPDEALAPPAPTAKTSLLFVAGADESRMSVSARVKKSDTIDIVALVPSIVQSLAVRPGQNVVSGQSVAILTADYASGVAALSEERAALQTSLTERSYQLEKEIIDLQKKITKADPTKTDREGKAASRQAELDLKRLKADRETARLDLALAERSDAALHPKSLVRGTVEHIAVRPGDVVTPGTVLMTLHATAGSSTLEAAFPKKLADALLDSGSAELQIGTASYTLSSGYQARSENAAGLVIVTYPLPHDLSDQLAQHDYVTLSVPLVPKYRDSYLVPIDAIRSTSVATSVVIMEADHVTRGQPVTLGETIGASVVVQSGLEPSDTLVLNAAVLPGETIEPIR
ncbi:MAG: hypothetical protein WBO92_02705 [Candidatus Moraniibacteriota bacterium]